MTVTATVSNDTIRLPKGVHFPDGTKVIIERVALPKESCNLPLGQCLADFIGIADDLPKDLARNLDHYVHGQSKSS